MPMCCTDQATSLESGICSIKKLPAQLQGAASSRATHQPIVLKPWRKNSTEVDCFLICHTKPRRGCCRSVYSHTFSSTSCHKLKSTCPMWQKLYHTVTGLEFLLISTLVSDREEDVQDTLQDGSGYK